MANKYHPDIFINGQCEAVYSVLREAGPLTLDNIHIRSGVHPYNVSIACQLLVSMGLIVKSDTLPYTFSAVAG